MEKALHIKSSVKTLGVVCAVVAGFSTVALFTTLSKGGQSGIAFAVCLILLAVFSGVYKDILYSLKCPICNQKAGITMSQKRWAYFPRECVSCGQKIN